MIPTLDIEVKNYFKMKELKTKVPRNLSEHRSCFVKEAYNTRYYLERKNIGKVENIIIVMD